MEVFNSAGETVFNTNDYVELGSANFTITGTDLDNIPSNTGLVDIPDYCFGDDVNDYLGSGINYQSIVISSSGYSTVYEMAVRVTTIYNTFFAMFMSTSGPAVGDKLFQYMYTNGLVTAANNTGLVNSSTMNSASSGVYGVTGDGSQVSHYANAYRVVTMSINVSSLRTSTGTRNFKKLTTYAAKPVVYARPLSSSYVGEFALRTLNRKIWIIDYTGGNNTFEVIIANSAEEWGSISNASRQLGGAQTYGVRCFTSHDQKYTPVHTAGPFLTYDSSTRPAQIMLVKGYAGGTPGTTATFSLGSLNSSTTKRWCRMGPTELYKSNMQSSPYRWWKAVYKWNSNHNISVNWRAAETTGIPYGGTYTTFVAFATYASKFPYAVAEFGEGA
jgi:hypothetical protein